MKLLIIAGAACLLLLPVSLVAQEPMVYPAQGQDEKTMEKDKYECYTWAKQQTGFDPMQPQQQTTTATPQSNGRSVGRSAVRGAAIGGLAGSMGGEFGKGAAVGAGAGIVTEGIRQRRQTGTQQQQQATTARQQEASRYQRAFSACMEGRGYSVK